MECNLPKEENWLVKELTEIFVPKVLDALKLPTYKAALDTVPNLSEMSDDEFESLLSERLSPLSGIELAEAQRVIEKRKNDYETNPDELLSLREIILLDVQAMVESHQASVKHSEKTGEIDLDELRQVKVGEQKALAPEEIRLLDKMNGAKASSSAIPSCFTHEYNMDCSVAMKKLISCGYLTFAGIEDDVHLSDMQILRDLAKAKGLKAGGKKTDIADRVLQNYTVEELKNARLKNHFVATEAGKELLRKNDALIRYYSAFSDNWTTPERIMVEQKLHPDESGTDILIRIAYDEIERRKGGFTRHLYFHLWQMYIWKNDTEKADETKEIIDRLDSEMLHEIS